MDADSAGGLEGAGLVDWRTLPPGRRRAWWQALWTAAIALAERYRLALRSGWWQDPIQVEALAAFCCWLRLYDTGAESDPTGKLQLLWELERLRTVLRAGEQPFDARGDQPAFEHHLANLTGQHRSPDARGGDAQASRVLVEELTATTDRLAELRHRERRLQADREGNDRGLSGQGRAELHALQATIKQLTAREDELRNRLGQIVPGDAPGSDYP
jgi:hypothetical protein